MWGLRPSMRLPSCRAPYPPTSVPRQRWLPLTVPFGPCDMEERRLLHGTIPSIQAQVLNSKLVPQLGRRVKRAENCMDSSRGIGCIHLTHENPWIEPPLRAVQPAAVQLTSPTSCQLLVTSWLRIVLSSQHVQKV